MGLGPIVPAWRSIGQKDRPLPLPAQPPSLSPHQDGGGGDVGHTGIAQSSLNGMYISVVEEMVGSSAPGSGPSWWGGLWIQVGSSGRTVEGSSQLPGPAMPSEWKLLSSNKSCPRR